MRRISYELQVSNTFEVVSLVPEEINFVDKIGIGLTGWFPIFHILVVPPITTVRIMSGPNLRA